MAPSRKLDITGTLQRLFYIFIGIAIIGLAIFRRITNGESVPLWKSALAFTAGLFFIYCGAVYYFPRYRRRRRELAAFLDELEAQDDADAHKNKRHR